VAALRIVEHLDVVEDVLPGFIARCIDLAANTLPFQQLEKTLGDGVDAPMSTGLCRRLQVRQNVRV
jgi:hypothetical protein